VRRSLFVDHRQDGELATVMGAVLDEVVGPDVARPLRPQPDAGAVREPQAPAARLLGRNLQPSRRQIRSTRLWFTLQPASRR
jgi:hypothetical protein